MIQRDDDSLPLDVGEAREDPGLVQVVLELLGGRAVARLRVGVDLVVLFQLLEPFLQRVFSGPAA